MLLDIIFLICLIAAFINGFRRGLIKALFSFVALFVGVLLALKYSYIVSDYLYRKDLVQSKALPLISFVFALIIILLLINLASRLVEKIAEAMFLGIPNKLIGGVLEAAMVTILFSIVLWYLEKMNYISSDVKTSSFSYDYLIVIAPKVISGISYILPFFGDVFQQLERWFERLPTPPSKGVFT